MLYLLFLYAFVTFICLITGILIYEWFSSQKNDGAHSHKPLIVYTISGLIVLTGIGQWLALLMPLTGLVNVIIISAPVILSFFFRKRVSSKLLQTWHSLKKLWPSVLICFCCFVIMILVINAGPIKMDDSESYHIQMVKWLREYGTVPGLANLHVRYGFNSAWFSSVGILTPSTEAINSYLLLNGLISCWFCFYLLDKLQQVYAISEKRVRLNIIVGIFLVLAAGLITWPMIRGNATNTNYDFITTVCLFVLFLEAMLADKFRFGWEWVVWPCFLFTVRIINYPVLLLTLYVLIQIFKNKGYRRGLIYLSLAFLLIAPFIARNVLLSGYAFFPAYQVDIFSVDWKTDRQMTEAKLDYIRYYNRVNVMHKPLQETKALSFPFWIREWFRYLFPGEKPLVVASLCGFATWLILFNSMKRQLSGWTNFFLLAMLVQLVSWFFTAPDPRFVFGPLLCGLFLLAIALPPLNWGKLGKIVLTVTLLLLSGSVLAYSVGKIIFSPQHKNFVLPCELPQPGVETLEIDGIRMYIPKKINNNWNRRCYGTLLPCLYHVHPGLRARGKQISDGFYIENPGSYNFEEGVWY